MRAGERQTTRDTDRVDRRQGARPPARAPGEPAARLPRIAVRPLDLSSVGDAGPPGSPRRVMLLAACLALTGPRVWKHRGRGPEAYDWLGFVLACAQVVADNCFDAPIPLADPIAYGPGWDDGMPVAEAEALFARWGLQPRPVSEARPGDVIVFAMPAAHAAIVTAIDPAHGPRLAHAYWGRALTETWLDPWWRERAASAFGWPDAPGAGRRATTNP
jgi:hypothetical protein